ncbi:MASE3 domain-containing protein [Selenihalanaerobacter shriftii]|uniref:PAS domain S-box-containing protein/diguanylate cyclase (GGDEF) domain-containing protein n=1 Tax=Selenihalanaerobacter shriftii TaxID=142842 RepID=A0A1T4K3A5_9FIRM|nr:MASE3 domain-containing protein [Selenihalanaerobacter shriftii]SJZ36805.1 PAS domain S-box-containing protein/diguanylate cyclase (GGDEF) domain-containing protein [Selenihalanaerobacter shriftii]
MEGTLKQNSLMKNLIILLTLVVGFSYMGSKDYLLFHSSIELFSIIIAFNIFIIAFNTDHISSSNYFIFIGIAYGFIGFFDLIHVFSYKGMGIFSEYGANLPTQLWIISRYIESISLLIAFKFIKQRMDKYKIIYIYAFISIIFFISIFYLGIFPDAFVENSGLTQFKVISEYIISGILLIVIGLLIKNKTKFNQRMFEFMLGSIIMTILSEFAFTFYISVYGLSNMLGHLFKLISFYLIYRAINRTSLQRPYEILFHKLNQEKNKLQQYLNTAEVIFLVMNLEGEIKLINKKGCEILGYSRKEIIGNKWFEYFIIKKEKEEVRNLFEKIITGDLKSFKDFESNIITKGGTKKTIAWHNTILKDEEGNVKEVLSSGMDITKRKETEERIKYMSYHDSLTGLYNRKYYEDKLNQLNNEGQFPLSIIIGDVNGLKLINDVFGHDLGDKLLKDIARIIRNSTRDKDIIARWGGDEFGIILPKTNRQDAQKVIQRIKENCKASEFKPIPPNLALGSATKTRRNKNVENVFNKAEDEMYQDKMETKNDSKNPVLQTIIGRLEATNYKVVEHTNRMVKLAKKLGKNLNLTDDQIKELVLLVRFHDIGKFVISNEILSKQEPLTQEEWKEFKSHSEAGYNIAKNFKYLNSIANYILHHHENWDGTGYPQGLKENEIPLLSRINHIIDAYDAMTNEIYYPVNQETYYEIGLSKNDAIKELKKNSGKLFDSEIVSEFIELIE